MSAFTIRLDEVIATVYCEDPDVNTYEQTYESVTFNETIYGKLPVLPDNGIKIGLGNFPIFDEGYRKVITGKIIDQYWLREIGAETIDVFKLYIRRKLDQIMPYYNQLYESTLIDYKALDSMSIHSVSTSTVEGTEETSSSADSTSDNEAKARAVASETPQTMLRGNGDYASSASDSTSTTLANANSSQESNASNTNEANSDNLVTGYQGAASDLVTKYRNSLINIDTMILADIEDCFMLVLDNGDSYTNNYYPFGW